MSEIPLFKVAMSPQATTAVTQTLTSGYIGQGPRVEEFEQLLTQTIGNKNICTVNSATSGLELVFHLLKTKDNQRDEVLVCPLTCIASVLPIIHNGLKIRWVDLDLNTMNMDLMDLRRKLSKNTLAILPVHWGGYPNDLNALKEIQNECANLYGFWPPVVEDCAHAFGSKFEDKFLGNHGNICVYSFQAIKHLTTGDGGAIVFPDHLHELYRRAKLLRWYGLDRNSRDELDSRCIQNVIESGFRYSMNDITATLGISNLPLALENVQKHIENSIAIQSAMGGFCEPPSFQESKCNRVSASWILTCRVKRRTELQKYLKQQGITTSQVHSRLDHYSCFRNFRVSLPNLDRLSQEILCLPCGWWLTKDDMDCIIWHVLCGVRDGFFNTAQKS